MKFSILLLGLFVMLKVASRANPAFRRHILKSRVRVLIKTADGGVARLFIFDKGRLSTKAGDHRDFDVAMVWRDAETGYDVMTDKSPDASFEAAADGKLWVEGMSVYALWFEEGAKLALPS